MMTRNDRDVPADRLLDPQMRAFLELVAANAQRYPDPFRLPIAQARAVIEKTLRPFAKGGPAMHATEEREIVVNDRGIRIRLHHPVPDTSALIVYLHGGGWTWESPETHDRMAREYATRTGMSVLVPDYWLAPERPFPAAADEVVGLLKLLAKRLPPCENRPGVLLVGDSAGANLALSACMSLRHEPAMPRAMLLNYGPYSRDTARPSFDWIEESGIHPKQSQIEWFWKNYLGASNDGDWRAEPILGPFDGLPPMRLQVGQLDVLHDENMLVADAARLAGVDIECQVFSGVTHGFLRAVGRVEIADRAFEAGCRWLASKLPKVA